MVREKDQRSDQTGSSGPARVVQSRDELEEWWKDPDPWGYESTDADHTRRALLLAAIPKRHFLRVLDIGCGNGFVTERLPGDRVVGIDISSNAIAHANKRRSPKVSYECHSLFALPELGWSEPFDLIVITGVLYPQYIGRSERLVYAIIDDLLTQGGNLVSCHIDEWYQTRFPYVTLSREYYTYREYTHVLEVYAK
ncbi:MAG: class I SAM-dependent methyltransferase [Acidobacteriia bacterium]|nr:class I SAM-dependent methyltransferase [Terriglobia bacterium]